MREALSVEAIGDAITTHGIRGHLERSIDRHFLVRVDDPVPGYLSFFAFGADDGSGVHLQGFLFSDDAPGVRRAGAAALADLARWRGCRVLRRPRDVTMR